MKRIIFLSLFTLISIAIVEGYNNNPNRPPSLGFEFTESLEGYEYPTNTSCVPYNNETCYMNAYNAGKAAGDKVKFHLHATIANVTEFTSGENHICTAVGTIYVEGLTNMITGTDVLNGSIINVFYGGVQNDTLYLSYFLPFVGNDGKNYHLGGTKFIYSNNCLHVISMASTLYITIAEGHVPNEGNVYSVGMIDMSDIGILSFLLSLGVVGEGTDAQKVITWAEFIGFLVEDVLQLCFVDANYKTNFWYIWASDGNHGFLLDMIQHPTQLELRLDMYDNSANATEHAVVYKQYFPIDDLHFSVGNWLEMGPVLLNAQSCTGSVDNITLDVSFTLNGRYDDFIPTIVANKIPFIPDMKSNYGSISKTSTVGGFQFAAGVPMVFSQYPVDIGIDFVKWTMISAQLFNRTDLQVEVIGMEVLGIWLGTGYVYFNGDQYHMDDPINPFSHSKWVQTGELVNGTRTFEVQVKHDEIIGKNLDMTVVCTAPEGKFALLDDMGNTQIMTTLLGECYAIDNNSGDIYTTPSSSLLERKEKITATDF